MFRWFADARLARERRRLKKIALENELLRTENAELKRQIRCQQDFIDSMACAARARSAQNMAIAEKLTENGRG